ncbi:hypothetical protein AeMF1_015637 [Aphanomyces euteiches]|nr:hypothetical protein AeMF1_015637 [Aphanomyces euteiches]
MARDVLTRLADASNEEAENLRRASLLYEGVLQENEDDETFGDFDTPYIDSYANQGTQAFITMTNLSLTEFNRLWSLCECEGNAAWYEGRGRKNRVSAKDAFFMLLTLLKHYNTWDKHAADFGISLPTFEKMVMRMMRLTEPVLVSQLVTQVNMKNQCESGLSFANHPEALYATDVKFQPAYRPNGPFLDVKRYFSPKHKLYGYKLEGSVAMPGRYVDVSDHHPGSASDVTIFMTRIDKHHLMLTKTEDDKKMVDIGEGSSAFPNLWATLQDKGYQGVDDAIRSIRPTKKPKNASMTRQELKGNNRVSSDRVLVENMFGRTCSLWKIAYATFTWSEEKYDLVQCLVWALTNFHTSLHPLRAQDKEFYSSVMARYISMAEERVEKKKSQRQASRDRRQVRLDLDRSSRDGSMGTQYFQGY